MMLLKSVQTMVSGKKVYALCFLAFVYAVLGIILDNLSAEEAGKIIWEALAFAGLRAGVAKIQ